MTFPEFIIQAERIVRSLERGSIIDESHRAYSHPDTADNENFDDDEFLLYW
jgi:hypothetical protein